MTTNRGGRSATGSLRVLRSKEPPHEKCWHARFTYANGERSDFFPLGTDIALDDRAGAKAYAARIAERIKNEGIIPHPKANGAPSPDTDDKSEYLRKEIRLSANALVSVLGRIANALEAIANATPIDWDARKAERLAEAEPALHPPDGRPEF